MNVMKQIATRDPDGRIFVEISVVTVAMARAMLKLEHPDNRKPSSSRVKAYASDMKAGRWHRNGETIKFDRSGRLIDGGHRLRAIVSSGTEIELTIVTNAESMGIDRGRARSALDARRMNGERVNALYIAALKILYGLRRGAHGFLSDEDTYSIELECPVEASWLRKRSGSKRMTASVLGSIAFTIPILGDSATVFYEQITTLENLAPGSPALNLIRQLAQMSGLGGKWSRGASLLTLQALRVFSENKTQRCIRATEDSYVWWCRKLGIPSPSPR